VTDDGGAKERGVESHDLVHIPQLGVVYIKKEKKMSLKRKIFINICGCTRTGKLLLLLLKYYLWIYYFEFR
jgi:hypothetical protein